MERLPHRSIKLARQGISTKWSGSHATINITAKELTELACAAAEIRSRAGVGAEARTMEPKARRTAEEP